MEEILKNSKIVLCLRNPKEIVSSIKELKTNIHVVKNNNWISHLKVGPVDPIRYINRMSKFLIYLNNNKWLFDNIIILDTDKYYSDPVNIITYLCNSLNLDVSKIEEAVKCIDTSLYRFKDDYMWPANKVVEGQLAERIFEGLKNKSIDIDSIKGFIESKKIENARWLDNEFNTNTIIDCDLYNSLKNNNRGIRDKLQKSSKVRSINCKYKTESEEKYTIKRSIGDITRKLILCTKDNSLRTLEHCHLCMRANYGIK